MQSNVSGTDVYSSRFVFEKHHTFAYCNLSIITQLAEGGRARVEQMEKERSRMAALAKEKEELERCLAGEEENRKQAATVVAAQRVALAKEKEKRETLQRQLVQASSPQRHHLQRTCTQPKRAVQRPPITVSHVFFSVCVCVGETSWV